ncbi:hypothetical protein D3C81_1267410 [compost metagenome]
MVHGVGQAPGRKLAVGQVGAVGEGFEHQRHVGSVGQFQFTAVVGQRQHHQRQALAVGGARIEHGAQQGVVADQIVV